ncbi:hypothetical protein J6W78_06080 [bacterium]|nr:hypothetical protein [bacterium]
MGKLFFCLSFCKKIFFLCTIFLLFFAQANLFVYLENMVSCFPVTIITTQKAPVEEKISAMKVCSVSVQSERMTFDSSIFNHYETLPVKEIYLYSMKIPYENWSEVKNMEDVITEANPYIEDIVSSYAASKIRLQLFSFIFLMLIGVYFVFKIVASNKSSKKSFFVVSIIISVLYLSASVALLNVFPAFVMPLSAVSSGVLLLVYVIISLLNYRLAKW